MKNTEHKFSIYKNNQGFYRIKYDTYHCDRWLCDSDMLPVMVSSHRSKVFTFTSLRAAKEKIAEYYITWIRWEQTQIFDKLIQKEQTIISDTWEKVEE